jgi:pseudouridine synthase
MFPLQASRTIVSGNPASINLLLPEHILLTTSDGLWYTGTMKDKSAMTLDRILSRFGISSRAAAGEAIRGGRVKVNGRTVRDPQHWVRPALDAVHLDGKRVKQARKVYLLFYKPKGVITSHGDPDARATIYDYLAPDLPWVSPVGRLDQDSSGLLLLTNDTEFANLVTDPASGITKKYLVKLNGIIDDPTLASLRSGLRMKRGDWAQPRSVMRIEDRGKYSWLEVVLAEGKNREVRRMVEAVGFQVLKLVRTGIGRLTLEGLEVGKHRTVSRQELSALKNRSS